MKLFAKIVSGTEVHFARESTLNGEGWYEIEREPDPSTETLRYDLETDSVLIEKRTVTSEQIAAKEKAAEDATLMKADTIRGLQAKIAELESRLAKVEEGKI